MSLRNRGRQFDATGGKAVSGRCSKELGQLFCRVAEFDRERVFVTQAGEVHRGQGMIQYMQLRHLNAPRLPNCKPDFRILMFAVWGREFVSGRQQT